MNKVMNRLLLAGALLLGAGTSVSAAPLISAQSIIVNPVGSPLQVAVWTDRDPSGTKTPNYRVGEAIHLYATVNQDAYVYLFDLARDGTITQILPNRLDGGDNFIRSHTVRSFPGQGADFRFSVGGATGVSRVLAVASRTPLDLSGISSFAQGSNFATLAVRGQEQLAQALSVVISPLPDSGWGTGLLSFDVQPSAPAVQVVPEPAVSTVVVIGAPPPPPVVVYTPAPPPQVVYTPAPPPQVIVTPAPPPRVVIEPAPPPRVVLQPAPPPFVVTRPGPVPQGSGASLTIISLSPYARASELRPVNGGFVFRSPDRVEQVYAYYDAELTRQGYRRVSSSVGPSVASATYVTRDGGRATLRVHKDRDRVDVSLKRS